MSSEIIEKAETWMKKIPEDELSTIIGLYLSSKSYRFGAWEIRILNKKPMPKLTLTNIYGRGVLQLQLLCDGSIAVNEW